MKRTLTALTVVAVFAAAPVAFAQYEKPIGLSPRIGVIFPQNSSMREDAGRTILGAGLDYKFRDLKFGDEAGKSGTIFLSVDYYGRNKYTNVPLTANYVLRNNEFYYGGGLGISFGRVPDALGNTSTTTNLAFALTVGYDFVRGATPLFVEVKYHGSGESRVNALGFYAGVRL